MTEILCKYQEVDGQIKKIVDEINRSEEAKTSKKWGHFLKEAEDNLKKMEARAKELAVTYANLNKKFAEYAKPLAELESGVEQAIDAGELNYISKKLADTVKNVGAAEREASAVHKEMEEMLNRYDQLREKVPGAQKKHAEARAAVNNKKKEKETEITSLQKQKADLEKKLEAQTLEIYQRLRSQGLFPVCVRLDGNRCGGCRMDIPSGAVSKLSSVNFILCENCGRIVTK